MLATCPAEMLTVRLVYHVAKDDPEAGNDLYASDPEACRAVAVAETESLSADERLKIRGDLPERVEQYCARAWSLIDDTLSVLGLPPEVVESISGDMIALFAAGLLTKDVREAGAEEHRRGRGLAWRRQQSAPARWEPPGAWTTR